MNIVMPRGDLRQVAFTIRSPDDGSPITDFSEIFFTVKKTYKDRLFLFQKRLTKGDIVLNEEDGYQFTILPKDTDKLPFGEYVYDIEVVREEDIKQTFAGRLLLSEEVTYSENER